MKRRALSALVILILMANVSMAGSNAKLYRASMLNPLTDERYTMDIDIRKAIQSDIKDIRKLLSYYALDTEMVEKNLPEFIVAVKDGKMVGCACLDVSDIVELRSIAILPSYRNKGIGSELVNVVLKCASEITGKVYLRTTSPGFFEKKGAHRTENDEKRLIWKECYECDKFDICKQVLMEFDLQKKNNH